MTRRGAFSQADVSRLIRGALAAGLPVGSFAISVETDRLTLLPATPIDPLPSVTNAEDAWDRALGIP